MDNEIIGSAQFGAKVFENKAIVLRPSICYFAIAAKSKLNKREYLSKFK
jgi:hypothetical protein